MAKYDVECPDCGATYRVNLIGPHKDRQWKLDNFDWTCDECREKARQAENANAAAANAEAGLPPLAGTEKMIAWAELIRKQKLTTLAEEIKKRDLATAPDRERVEMAVIKLQNKTSARWWIDNRDTSVLLMLREEYQTTDTPLPPAEQKIAEEAKIEAMSEATIRPERIITETVAEIRALDNAIEVHFPEKREDYWQLIKKQLHFTWTGSCWRRDLTIFNGMPADRAAEVGNRLLAAGFIIRIFNSEIRTAAIAGTFTQECTRWIKGITSGTYEGWFSISWSCDEDFYKAAKAIKGSRYSKPNVIVPPEQFEQVLDFAEMYAFQLSAVARAVADKAKAVKDAALTAKVEERVSERPPMPGEKPKKLAVPENVEVANEFKD